MNYNNQNLLLQSNNTNIPDFSVNEEINPNDSTSQIVITKQLFKNDRKNERVSEVMR